MVRCVVKVSVRVNSSINIKWLMFGTAGCVCPVGYCC